MSEHEKYLQESFKYNLGAEKYVDCMREIKKRLNAVKTFIDTEFPTGNPILNTEFICLQFRSIVELILLANLATHQNDYIKGFDKLKSEWRLDSMFKFLFDLNKDFYPVPITETFSEGNPKMPIYLDIKNGFLTLKDIDNIHNQCSNYLHPKNPFADERNYDINNYFSGWISKIEVLLKLHNFLMPDPNWAMLIRIDFDAIEDENKKDITFEIWRRQT